MYCGARLRKRPPFRLLEVGAAHFMAMARKMEYLLVRRVRFLRDEAGNWLDNMLCRAVLMKMARSRFSPYRAIFFARLILRRGKRYETARMYLHCGGRAVVTRSASAAGLPVLKSTLHRRRQSWRN